MGGLSEKKSTGMSLTGLDTQIGLPRDGFITENTARKAVLETVDALVAELDEFIHRIPPQVYEKVRVDGIYLTGGSAKIEGIRDYLTEKLGIPVREPQQFEYSIVNGLKKMMNDDELLQFANTPATR